MNQQQNAIFENLCSLFHAYDAGYDIYLRKCLVSYGLASIEQYIANQKEESEPIICTHYEREPEQEMSLIEKFNRALKRNAEFKEQKNPIR